MLKFENNKCKICFYHKFIFPLHAIKRELTARRTPQQNGVSKRKNRIIVEMARSMQGKNLPKRYWAEAVHTVVYILNRSSTKAVKDLTPYEA